MTDFTLIGHDSPTEDYPGPVVPIGLSDGDMVVAYATNDSTVFDKIAEGAPFVRHDSATRSALHDFDPNHERLFALTRDHVVSYAIASEGEFFTKILTTEQLSHINPFLRLSMTKRAAAQQLIEQEWIRCAAELDNFAPGLAAQYGRYDSLNAGTITPIAFHRDLSRPFEVSVAALWRDLGATTFKFVRIPSSTCI